MKVAEEIRSCKLCELSQSRINPVPGEGAEDAEIMFIGEGPGAEEDRQGRPFVGAAGKLLNEFLKNAGLQRDSVFITNVVKCRPPGNRRPTYKERESCKPYLQRQIELIKPKIICLLGNTAVQTMLGRNSVSSVHNRLVEKDGLRFIATYHPAAAIYNPQLKTIIQSDISRLKVELEKLKSSRKEVKLHEFFTEC
ncbi:MAG: uracil-DNA glycosylase [Nitrososphaerales archaeon]|nr:uracil-DNA glycosylase [Nitrososphaerales archaeon]